MDWQTQTPPPLQAAPSGLRGWLGRHKSRVLFAAALVLIVGTGVGLVVWLNQPWPSDASLITTKPTPPPKKFYSPLTGVLVGDEAATKRPVTAIMIENSPDARPQSGIKDGGIIFETIAEAGITRFIVLYQEAQPGLVGPVRSIRLYYIEWASSFDPSVAHVGGSSHALAVIRGGGFGVDLDQFFNGGSYWRAKDRAAPHNVYTDFSHLNALNQSKGKTSSKFWPWLRKDETPAAAPTATKIDLPISSAAFNVHYDYDKASNTYLRSEGGAPHVDREGGRLAPKVVVALKVPITVGFEDGYREQINTTGSGEADIFQDGTVTKATWTKPSAVAQLTFNDSAGHPIALDRGQVWITALDPSKNVTWQ